MGQRIAARRAILGWTQEDLAEASGVSRGHIAAVEAGTSGLSPSNLFSVADALKVDARWLWHGDKAVKAC